MNSGEIAMPSRKFVSTLALCLIFTVGVVAAQVAPPTVTVDGLYLVKDTEMALVYAKPGVDLSQYNRIYLTMPQVSFTKDWLKDQNKVPNRTIKKEDMQRIKYDLATLFSEVFMKELQDVGGYVLVDAADEDVLIVHPVIVDLNVVAPDTPSTRNSRSLIAGVGSMTLYMELIDSVTGDMMVKTIDNKYRNDESPIPKPNKVRNEAAARDMLGEWAELLRKGLDEARAVVKGD
jgi:hypothetical protein